MMDIIGKKWFYFIFSGLIIVPGLIALLLWGLRPGIDFTGGTLLEVNFEKNTATSSAALLPVAPDNIRKVAETQNLGLASVQPTGNNSYLLRLKPITKDQNQKLEEQLAGKFGKLTELRFETVGPSIGKETTQNAVKAVLLASLAIVIYIALAFRKIPKPYSSFKFGICAVAALIHDVLVVIGLFSIFGHFFKVEVDTLFITALLTVMGFSVHDTIVVFDRIRENLIKTGGVSFTRVVNESILQTLARSLSTSLTVLFTLFALFLFGGETIKWFIVALLIGITSGTYSSIFNAAPLLVVWEESGSKK